jgi:hypothetical protein
MPSGCAAPGDPEVPRLSDRQADRERRDRDLLELGITASLDALAMTVGEDLDVQVLVVAAFGDPFAAEAEDPRRWVSVPIHARFASLRAQRTLTEAHRRYLALEGLRAVSPSLRDELAVALGLLDTLEDLQQRADGGDTEAEEKHALIIGALYRDAPPPTPA